MLLTLYMPIIDPSSIPEWLYSKLSFVLAIYYHVQSDHAPPACMTICPLYDNSVF